MIGPRAAGCAGHTAAGWVRDEAPPRCPRPAKWRVRVGEGAAVAAVCGVHLSWYIGQTVTKPWESVSVSLSDPIERPR